MKKDVFVASGKSSKGQGKQQESTSVSMASARQIFCIALCAALRMVKNTYLYRLKTRICREA